MSCTLHSEHLDQDGVKIVDSKNSDGSDIKK